MARTETVTVVFTDLVGSTELASRLGHDAYEALRHEHFTALRGAVTQHNGSEVKTTGDGLMLRFDSAASAIACAVAMQQAISGAGRGRPPSGPPLARGEDRGVQIRIGISSGEATREEGDVYGPPVVEAARLCAVAAGEQIVISDVVRSLARGCGHTFASVGELTLKGLPEPVASFAVHWEPLTTGVPLPPRLATTAAVAMVGRGAEQDVLARAWERVKAGERQTVLLAGEPGIGKTRLATEAARTCHADGATVLLGTCDEDCNPPYHPFVEALRHYVTHAPETVLAAHGREHKGELTRLLPELGRRIADLPPPQVAEAETERYLLFEAATGLLSAASQEAPIVLILDDLQWAGTPELVLLKHVLRSTMPLRLLVVGTYRDSDLTRTHPLTAALADWRRQPGVERLTLHGLDETAVVGLLTAAAGHELAEPGIALARALHRETEGSPFFIGEILRNLTESGAVFQEGDRWTYRGDIAALGIPEGIKEVIGRRLNRLSEETNKVLSLAAVIGRQFDVALLVRIADMPEDAVLNALEAATAAALVAELPGSADRYAFSHALVRTTLYEELSAARRARLHRRVGEALEELTGAAPEARIGELAHHWLNATQVADAGKAIGYARLAGDRALTELAFEEAATHYERALSVLAPRDRDGAALQCDLLLALADARRRAGATDHRETAVRALTAARALGDAERLALAALGHARPGGFMANANVVDELLIALYEEADAALAGAQTITRARILAQLAVELIYTSQRDRRLALAREAVAIARRTGDRSGLAGVLHTILLAINDPFTLAERRVLSAELCELAAEIGGLELQFLAAYPAVGVQLESGASLEAEASLRTMERVGRELRQPFYAWWAQNGRAMWSVMRGDADAERQVMAAFEIGTAGGQPDAATAFGAQFFALREHQGRLAELTDAVKANVDAQPHIGAWRAAFASLLCESDRFEEARREMAALTAQGFAIPLNYSWIPGMATLAESCMQLDDAAAAAVIYERLSPIADQVYVLANVCLCNGSIHYWCGLLATCMRRWDDAERHFAAAIAVNERLGIRPFAVRSRRGWAEMLVNRNAPGDAAAALEIIDAGRAEAEQLGMGRELVRFERLRHRIEV